MLRSKIENYTNGWFIGDFDPAVFRSRDFEVCIKTFKKGDVEEAHFQKSAIEITLVVSGYCRMGTNMLATGDILLLEPGEISDFEALEDSVVLGVKAPSLPKDKVLASINRGEGL
jgi:quercetin dioxygenase-like cupin family protein